jgi:hypothetical protein
MKRPPLTWKQRLYRRTPTYITLAGYLLGFLILGAAVASWFVQTSIYSQATALVEPSISPVSLPQAALVLSQLRKPGDRVEPGEGLLEVSTDPRQVALRIVRDVAETGIEQLGRLADSSAADELADLRRLAAADIPTSAPRRISAPVGGWLLSRAGAAGDNAMVVPAGQPLATVGNLSRVTVRVVAATDHAPTVARGQRVPVLLGEFDTKDLMATLDDIQTTLTIEVPVTELTEQEWSALAGAASVPVSLLGATGRAQVTPGKDTVQISATASQFEGDSLTRARTAKSLKVTIGESEGVAVRGKLGSFQSAIVLSLNQDGLSPKVRDGLAAQLAKGIAVIPAGSCWVKVSTRSLFDRLFGK